MIAVALARAIEGLHTGGLIHRDIKPASVLVDRATNQVRLTNFGIASVLRRERLDPEANAHVLGTLAYMAPEQAGRMNRSVDHRSDLYSLGVTLYEVFTGWLPFAATDPLEWFHCHIALQPVPPTERRQRLPRPLSDLVMKLMAKAAEDRYQTARAAAEDYHHCLAEWRARGNIAPFALSGQASSGHLLIPERLYGRDKEIETLVKAFTRVQKTGKTRVVLVSGYSGVGKSSLVNELRQALLLSGDQFASGKLDRYKRDIPYATFVEAFQSLLRGITVLATEDQAIWRARLREALEPNGQLVVELLPQLESLVGPQIPVPTIRRRHARAGRPAIGRPAA
jgi:serine/threonine protein kinase